MCRPERHLRLLGLLGLLLVGAAGSARAYEGELHQTLTFVAAKHFNHCVADTDIPRLTPLQVRYMARTNVRQADRTPFARMFNWRYYDRGGQEERSLLWIIDTRFHEHFHALQERLLRPEPDVARRYSDLGRLVGYVQLVTSPAHVVPVFTGRFWRFSLTDRFDRFPIDSDALAARLDGDCSFLDGGARPFEDTLRRTADATLAAVQAPIPGMPITWEAFWELADNDDRFGEYGPAGNNFGRPTRFRCGDDQRCVLLDNDPLYFEFAAARHLDAVYASLDAIRLVQQALELDYALAD